jgi:hypothetical protein
MMQIEEIFFSLIKRTQLTLFNHQTVFSVVLFEADIKKTSTKKKRQFIVLFDVVFCLDFIFFLFLYVSFAYFENLRNEIVSPLSNNNSTYLVNRVNGVDIFISGENANLID